MISHEPNPTADTIAPGAPPRSAGFTLIELMITVVIATILMTIAIPIYLHQIRESRRTDARTALVDLAGREERYYATNNIYTNSATTLGYPAWGSGNPVGSGYYYLAAPSLNASSTTFSITAQPISGKGQDKDSDCTSFTVDNTGKQSAAGANPGSCWQ